MSFSRKQLNLTQQSVEEIVEPCMQLGKVVTPRPPCTEDFLTRPDAIIKSDPCPDLQRQLAQILVKLDSLTEKVDKGFKDSTISNCRCPRSERTDGENIAAPTLSKVQPEFGEFDNGAFHKARQVLNRMESQVHVEYQPRVAGRRDELAAKALQRSATRAPRLGRRSTTSIAGGAGEQNMDELETRRHDDRLPTIQSDLTASEKSSKDLKVSRSSMSLSSSTSGLARQAVKKVIAKSFDVSTRIRVRSQLAVDVWQFFEDPESSFGAFLYSRLTPIVVVMSVVLTVLLNVEVETVAIIPDPAGATMEIILEGAFLLEYVIRISVCPNRVAFVLHFNNIIDTLSFLPLFLRANEGFVLPDRTSTAVVPSILFGVVPAVRLLKVLRYFQSFRLLLSAFKVAFEALPVMLYTLAIMGLIFSSMIYFVEDRSNVDSLPRAMWLMIITMTTVGYGDITPKTTLGTCFVAVMAISSVLYMAIPLGLIGNAFNEVWKDRHRIILVQRAKYCLTQWGYTADTIPGLFEDYDDNGDGELNLAEFRAMMNHMRVGLPPKAITKLFDTFDADQSGFITSVEFVRHIFPKEYHELFAEAIDEPMVQPGFGGQEYPGSPGSSSLSLHRMMDSVTGLVRKFPSRMQSSESNGNSGAKSTLPERG